MARLSRWASRWTSSLLRSGIERLGDPPQVGEVDEEVEGDDRRQHEDDGDVEHPQAELARPVELLLEGEVVARCRTSRRGPPIGGIWTGQSFATERSWRSLTSSSRSARISRPLVGEVVGLALGERGDEEADQRDEPHHAEVGEACAQRPGDVAAVEERHHRVEDEDDGAGEDQRRPDDPEEPGHDAEQRDQRGESDDRPCHLPARRMRSAFDNGCTGWTGVLAAVGAIDAAR